MAISSTRHALPRDRRMFVTAEATYGTLVQAAATDAVSILTGGIESHVINRIERDDNRATRSLVAQITGAIEPVPWAINTYLAPSGAAGTAPDVDVLLEKAMGVGTNTPATSEAYTLSDSQGALGSFSLHEAMGRVDVVGALGFNMAESLAGCIVQSMKLSGSAGEPVMAEFSGVGSKYVLTGRGALTSSPAGVDNFTASANDISNLRVGSLIGVYAAADGSTVVDTNSGAGHIVTAIAGTTVTCGASTITASSADIFAPLALVPTTAGSPSPGIIGSLSLGGTQVPVTAWEVTLDNGLVPHADEAFQQNATGYHEDKRRVSGQVTLRAAADQIDQLGLRTDLGTRALSIVVGTTAGAITTVTCPTVEYGFASVDKGGDVAIITLPFKSLGTTNELAVTFT